MQERIDALHDPCQDKLLKCPLLRLALAHITTDTFGSN